MSEHLTTLPISDVHVGMYIDSLPDSEKAKVKVKGVLPSKRMYNALVQQGIKRVRIDLQRSRVGLSGETLQAESREQSEHFSDDGAFYIPLPDVELVCENYADEPKTPYEIEAKYAEQLYGQARALARLNFARAQNGEPVDVATAELLSEQIVRSIFRNESALLCLSRLRHKDHYLLEHSIGVAILLGVFARRHGLPDEEIRQMVVGGLLHDVGKVNVDDAILNKPGKLDEDEFLQMQGHVLGSYRILRNMPDISPLMLQMAANHHERPDGTGYPRGLEGEQLSRHSRMIAIVDSYDALTADRAYKPGMESTRALRIMLKNSPAQFDRELVVEFIKCIGVYPVGTLVMLASGLVSVVVDHGNSPVTPRVKAVYNARQKKVIAHSIINLDDGEDTIRGATLAEKYGLEMDDLI